MPDRKYWNWEQSDWPHFTFDAAKIEPFEHEFLLKAGICSGTIKHVHGEDKDFLTVQLISNEALRTSEIEGEILNRESLQSSIRRNFGLAVDNRKIPPAEQGIAEMMADLYYHFQAPLSDKILFCWHDLLMKGRRDLKEIGAYRTDESAMQVVSGASHAPKVHFEAPPSKQMAQEMKAFISWFNDSGLDGKKPLPPLTRAGIAHLYFVSIHPFEDGNGRIGRAISEKVLSQALNQPTLIALSQVINARRKHYYDGLENNNKRNELTDWLLYFAKTILEGQEFTQKTIDLLINQTKFLDRFKGQFNPRQEKVVRRLFREEPEGFKGGLSAENYVRMAETSRATATRDLQDLVAKGALKQTGAFKSTRYHLQLDAVKGG